MPLNHITAGALVWLAFSVPAMAQEPAALLVEVEWLSQHLNDRGLVVLHVGDKAGPTRVTSPGRVSSPSRMSPRRGNKATSEP